MIFSPKIVIAGDSLAACCPFDKLSLRPFAVRNLAESGARLADVAAQLADAREVSARCALIDGGLNDLLGDGAALARIEGDFRALLRQLVPGRKTIFTLMPHVADPAFAERIESVNVLMAKLCAQYGVATLDLNPELSVDGVLRPEMTTDGLHFSPRANAIWIAKAREMISMN